MLSVLYKILNNGIKLRSIKGVLISIQGGSRQFYIEVMEGKSQDDFFLNRRKVKIPIVTAHVELQ
jgi:hypothetical protein